MTTHELDNTTAAAGEQPPQVGRRGLLATASIVTAAAGVTTLTAAPAQAAPQWTTKWDKTFPKSKLVKHRKVSFPDRLGNTLVAEHLLAEEERCRPLTLGPRRGASLRRGQGTGLGPIRADHGRAWFPHSRLRCRLQR